MATKKLSKSGQEDLEELGIEQQRTTPGHWTFVGRLPTGTKDRIL